MENTESVAPGVDHPAEVAFRGACRAFEALSPDFDPDGSRALFEEAVRLGGPDMLWRVADECLDTEEGPQWMSRAVVSESVPGGITVDPNTLRIERIDGVPHQKWEIAVESDDHARAVAALTAAADRMWTVFEDGGERTPEEVEYGLIDLYNPNFVDVNETVPSVWMDCKDGIMPHMARTDLRIIADELRKAGIRQAHLYTPSTDA
ncbi:hypothetical protein [Streptomyces lushanensis]|uniref:hypothetical protein n=1 Tax=Streptomyces lushanensis TaxID=1434255 RepID=UPI00082F24B3|nr:hypothetical protein [Streptomyces lushanensis]